MKQVQLHKRAILFFALSLYSLVSTAQNADSASLHSLRIIAGAQLSDQINGGLYYKGTGWNNKSDFYKKALSIPMLSVSFGAKFKNVFNIFDFAYRSRTGFYDRGIGKDYITVKYLSYQVWYDFFKKKDFPIKPLVSLNLAYADKLYEFTMPSDKPDASSFRFEDLSKTYIIDLPIGIYSHYQHFFVSFSYNIPIFSWIDGSFQQHTTEYKSGVPKSTEFTENDYTGDASQRGNYQIQRSVFNLRIAYTFILDK